MSRRQLMRWDDADRIGAEEIARLHQLHFGKGQLHYLKLLGFDQFVIDRAEGASLHDRRGREIFDFFGGFGSLAVGHNHPRILDASAKFRAAGHHDIAPAFLNQYATVLAHDLAQFTPPGIDGITLATTGSEAVEAALKLAERVQGRKRNGVVAMMRGFHGRTVGALGVSDSAVFRGNLELSPRRTFVEFGDADALDEALARDRSMGTVILEPIQGGAGIMVPPAGYLRDVRRVCDRHGALLIADEVQCGIGRSGKFFAFEHDGIEPDIVCIAKSLGGGKMPIAATAARRSIFEQAFGSPKSFVVNAGSAMSGTGEACVIAIETLNIIEDENLIDRAAVEGAWLLSELEKLKAHHPKLIKDVRGKGLMIGIEFADVGDALPAALGLAASPFAGVLRGALCGFVGSLLLEEFGILVAFTEMNRNVIRLEPPLIMPRAASQKLVESLDRLLARGMFGLAARFAKGLAFG